MYSTFIEECISRVPLISIKYETDTRQVHQLIICPCVLEMINGWTWRVLVSYLIPMSGTLAINSSIKVEYTVVPSGISNSRITYIKGTPNVPYKVFNSFSKASDHLVQSFSPFKAPGAVSMMMVSLWSFYFLMIAARLPAFLSAERKLSWSS